MSTASKRIMLFVVVAIATTVALKASAETRPEIWPPPVCEGPISTCGPVSDATDVARACPLGYECRCVPSCPACADCAAFVCVRPQRFECRTACDCDPGLACVDGRCLAGLTDAFAPVFCCDSDVCPAGNQCQWRDGRSGRCEDPMDPSCRKRVAKVRKLVERLVERSARCEVDTDCVQISTSTQCQGTCGAAVNEEYAEKIERVLEKVDRKICEPYREAGCPYSTPACLAVLLEPACIEQRCTLVPDDGAPPGPIRPAPGGSVDIRTLEERRLDVVAEP